MWELLVREVPDFLQNVLLPIAVGFALSRLAMYGWSRRAGARAGRLSPNPTSVMISMLFYVVWVFYLTMSVGRHTIDALAVDILFSSMLTAPVLFVVVPVFYIYILSDDAEVRRFLSNKFIYAMCALCLVAEIFWVGYMLSG